MGDIVYVDDNADTLKGIAPELDWSRFEIFEINQEESEEERNAELEQALVSARKATLWLFDFFFVDDVSHRTTLEENGLSLFNKWRSELRDDRPTTAVVSAHLETAFGKVGPQKRFHVLAQQAGVEWVGAKAEDDARKLLELADASKALASVLALPKVDNANVEPITLPFLCFDVLRVPKDVDWSRAAERHVDRARPPRLIATGEGRGKARSVLAWLLHNVFPYPSFLLTETHAAVRLGIEPSSFAKIIDGGSELAQLLDQVRYRGPLAELDKPRWWRAGVDQLQWKLSQKDVGLNAALREASSPHDLEFLSQREPVVRSDADLVETVCIVEAKECVRATDEYFPADVEPAWVLLKEALEDRKLAAKIIFEDQDFLRKKDVD